MSSHLRSPGRIVIIGAGPTGLGAAYRLQELGYDDFLVLERGAGPGGLAASIVDGHGFTWDIGGHVQFSHYAYYDRVVDETLVGEWLTHERESWVWIRNRFVPYPFQHNLHRLDAGDAERALEGLERAAARRGHTAPPEHFGAWIDATFGDGLADLFMRPYNLKVWGFPLESLDVGWMGERVAVPDVEKIRAQILNHRDEVSWGPNKTFRFPLRGGTGAIWRGVAARLPAARLTFDTTVVRIDANDRCLRLGNGDEVPYDTLVSTIPLDDCIDALSDAEAALVAARERLRHSAVHIVGIGLCGGMPEALARKCWMYFPESNSPYYRVTVFSNYSPHNVPEGGGYWSLMAEVCESPVRPVDHTRVVDDVVRAMVEDGLVSAQAQVVSRWHHWESHGYPTPFLGRDAVLNAIRASLETRRIFSRGRFGAWKYEVSNQDHSFMQGVELVDALVLGRAEVTVDHPAVANSMQFLRANDAR